MMERIELTTERLIITQFDLSMAESVHLNSLDEDTRRFTPDEVFETVDVAQETIEFLMECYKSNEGPFVYPILLKTGKNIGYVQAVPIDNGWEVGYHIALPYTKKGYAKEAVKAFVPYIMSQLKIDYIWGICRADNVASCAVLKHCHFELDSTYIGKYQGGNHEICRFVYRK